jgi:gliding motility-associated-like protein
MKLLYFLFLLPFSLFSQNQRVNQDFSQLKFIENKGQWDKSITFRTDVPHGTAYFSATAIAYTFHELPAHTHDKPHARIPNQKVNYHNLIIDFKHAQKSTITGEQAWPGEWNYLLGNDASKWTSHVTSYKKITYQNLYRGIVMEVMQHDEHLKYQFIVSPQTNPKQIKMEYHGAQSLTIQNGQLHVQTSLNRLIEDKPFAFQLINNERVIVDCQFKINRQTVSFELGEYDEHYPLVIDPDLIFSTYSGSPADNWGNTACQDNVGNVLVGGTIFKNTTLGEGFPTTPGAFQSDFQGLDTDILIFKLDSLGRNLIFATYLGGNDSEIPTSFVVDKRTNELVLLATSGSSNFPTTSAAYDRTFNGGIGLSDFVNCQVSPLVGGYTFKQGTDIVVTRLSEDGSYLKGSTYIGGTNNDGIIYQLDPLTHNYGDQLRGDIIIDDDGFVYVASNTHSFNFPRKNAFQGGYAGGNTDGVVLKFAPNLDQLVFSSPLGGASDDACFSIKLDNNNDVFVAGGTVSTNFPTSSNSYNQNKNGHVDAFITHILSDGGFITASTYVGTSAFDQAYFMDIGPDEHVYLFGQTLGDYPVTLGKYTNNKAGQFIHKLNKNLESSLWSTVVGSTNATVLPNISPTAFLVNDCGMILFSGWGGQVNDTEDLVYCWNTQGEITETKNLPSGYNGGNTDGMPITPNAFLATTDGSDFYIGVLETEATELLYATYFGAQGVVDHVDGGTSRFDKKGIIYQSVCAGCGGSNAFPQYPTTGNYEYPKANASQNCNNGIFKFNVSRLESKIKVNECVGLTTTIYNASLGGNRFEWDFGDGTTMVTFDKTPITHTYPDYGTYEIKLKIFDEATCLKEHSSLYTLKISPKIPSQYYSDSLCVGDEKKLTIKSFPSDSIVEWQPQLYLDNYTSYEPTITAVKSVDYEIRITDTSSCSRTDYYTLYIPILSLKVDGEIIGNCIGEVPKVNFNNTSQGVNEFYWDFGDGNTSNEKEAVYQFDTYGLQEIKLVGTTDHCSDSLEFSFTLYKVDVPNIITPNSDGKNDNFHPSGIENSGKWELDVYNRWGKMIYQKEDYLNEWDASAQEDGTYYYLLTAPDDSFCKGWVQVIR